MKRAFTLTEMLITIAIIAILLSIGIALGPGLMAPNEKARTKTTLNNLKSIVLEFQVVTDGLPPDYKTSWEFLTELQNESYGTISNMARSILDTVKIGNAVMPLDGWRNPIVYVNPKYYDNTCRDVDGDGLHVNDKGQNIDDGDMAYSIFVQKPFAYFVSSGPDGKFGDYSALERMKSGGSLNQALTAKAKEAADNIYSFDR